MQLKHLFSKGVGQEPPLREAPGASPSPSPFDQRQPVPAPRPEPSASPWRVPAEGLAAYGRAVDLARALLGGAAIGPEEVAPVLSGLEHLAVGDSLSSARLLAKATWGDYLPAHVVNVALLAFRLADRAGVPLEDRRTALWAGWVADLGMGPLRSIVLRGEPLTEADWEAVRRHPGASGDWCAGEAWWSTLPPEQGERVRRVAAEHHERVGGQGYPAGLSGDRMDPLSPLLQVADAYIAMVHPRTHRGAQRPHEAVKGLLGAAGTEFDAGAVKTLVEELSLYPPGSFLRLNSGAAACVLRAKEGYPTRPVVRLVEEGEVVDLTETPMVHVDAAVDPLEERGWEAKTRARALLAGWWA